LARFLVDESLPPQLALSLVAHGHEAVHALDAGLAGLDDSLVYAGADSRDSILLTLDLDFSDIRLFPGKASIIVIRLRYAMSRDEFVAFVVPLIERFEPQIEQLQNEVMILEPGRSRIRPRLL